MDGWMNGRTEVEIVLCGLKVKSLSSCQNQAIFADVTTRWQYMAT